MLAEELAQCSRVRVLQLLQRGPALQQVTAHDRIDIDPVQHLREIHLQGRLEAVVPAGLLIHHLPPLLHQHTQQTSFRRIGGEPAQSIAMMHHQFQ